MGRLVKTVVVLVAALVVVFGGTLAYKHLAGKNSVADHQPPLGSWATISVGGFSAQLPHQPKTASATTNGVTTTLFSLGADLDSLVVSVQQSAHTLPVDQFVRSVATSSKLQIAQTHQETIGGQPGETYRFVGTAGGQPVSAFGGAIVHGDQSIVIQYDVGGHPTATPAFIRKVLSTVTFSG